MYHACRITVNGFFVFAKIFAYFFVTFLHEFRIFAKIEKCFFVSTLVSTHSLYEYFLEEVEALSICQKLEMPECRNTGENVIPASLFLPLVIGVSPASAFGICFSPVPLVTD
jgi:hypothetical protein